MLALTYETEINGMSMLCNKLLLKYFMSAQDETEKIQRIRHFIEGAHYYWFCDTVKYQNIKRLHKKEFIKKFIEFCRELIVDDVFRLFWVSSFK